MQERERGRENEDVFLKHGFEGHLPMVIIIVLEAGSTSKDYLIPFSLFPSVLESQTSYFLSVRYCYC